MPENMVRFDARVKRDCQHCGACCFSDLVTYVRVTGDDHARLGEFAEDLTEFHGHRCYMRMVDGRCAALARDPLHGGFACSVYAVRPEVCRALERGSPACEAELLQKEGRARRALSVLPSLSDKPA